MTRKIKSLRTLRKKIAEGMSDIEAGRVYDGEAVFKEIEELDHIAKQKIRDDIEIGWKQAAKGQLIDADDAHKYLMKRAAKSRKKAKWEPETCRAGFQAWLLHTTLRQRKATPSPLYSGERGGAYCENNVL